MFVLLCSNANALLGPAPLAPKAVEQTEGGSLPPETPRQVAQLGEPDSAAPAARSESAFVAVPDLADRLKKLDPNAVIEWDGRRLRIQVQRQRFTLFLVTSDMVVNGTPERVSSPLRVYRGEIYVPQDAVDRIADVLAECARAPDWRDYDTGRGDAYARANASRYAHPNAHADAPTHTDANSHAVPHTHVDAFTDSFAKTLSNPVTDGHSATNGRAHGASSSGNCYR